jgi:hypothetical protein
MASSTRMRLTHAEEGPSGATPIFEEVVVVRHPVARFFEEDVNSYSKVVTIHIPEHGPWQIFDY